MGRRIVFASSRSRKERLRIERALMQGELFDLLLVRLLLLARRKMSKGCRRIVMSVLAKLTWIKAAVGIERI